jgi:uncharacterized RDD family membrane protein YckC
MSYVGNARRAGATAIDALVALIWVTPLIQYSKTVFHSDAGTTLTLYRFALTGSHAVWAVLITLGYYIVMEAAFGATVGKFATGIRSVRADGDKLGVGGSIVRNLMRFVDGFPYLVPYLVGGIAVARDPERRRRLGDRAAGSVVIRRPGSQTGGTQEARAWDPLAEITGDAPPLPPPPDAPNPANLSG